MSLYPHIFMQYNISPETFIGKVDVNFQDLVNGVDHNHGSMLKAKNYTLAASGALFSRDKIGFLPELLEDMFKKRKLAKDEMLILDRDYQKNKHDLSENEQKEVEKKIKYMTFTH